MADAATSVLAIAALTGGLFLGSGWLDPTMGIVGAGVVAVWAWGLISQTSKVLLDSEMDHPRIGSWNRRKPNPTGALLIKLAEEFYNPPRSVTELLASEESPDRSSMAGSLVQITGPCNPTQIATHQSAPRPMCGLKGASVEYPYPATRTAMNMNAAPKHVSPMSPRASAERP